MAVTADDFRVGVLGRGHPSVPRRRAAGRRCVKEPETKRAPGEARPTFDRAALKRLGGALLAGRRASPTLFTLARFSEAFLVLRVQGLGLPLALAPLTLVTMNVVYALAAYPAGALSDRLDRLTGRWRSASIC